MVLDDIYIGDNDEIQKTISAGIHIVHSYWESLLSNCSRAKDDERRFRDPFNRAYRRR